MDLQQNVKLHQGELFIELPLANILRYSMIHLTKLRIEFQAETGSSNIDDFWLWIEKRLGLGKGKMVLL